MINPNALACNIDEAAELLHVSRPTMLKIAHLEGFPGFRIGNRWIINIKGLQRWLDEKCGILSETDIPNLPGVKLCS